MKQNQSRQTSHFNHQSPEPKRWCLLMASRVFGRSDLHTHIRHPARQEKVLKSQIYLRTPDDPQRRWCWWWLSRRDDDGCSLFGTRVVVQSTPIETRSHPRKWSWRRSHQIIKRQSENNKTKQCAACSAFA